jgi:hypothetical protein
LKIENLKFVIAEGAFRWTADDTDFTDKKRSAGKELLNQIVWVLRMERKTLLMVD